MAAACWAMTSHMMDHCSTRKLCSGIPRRWHLNAAVDIAYAGPEGNEVGTLKKAIIRSVAKTNRGKETTYEQRQQILKLIERLESDNPTMHPLESPLITGLWSLIYTAPIDETTADKYAGTEEGPFLARLKPLAFGAIRQTQSLQLIDTANGIAENVAAFRLFGLDGTLKISGKAARSTQPGKETVRLDVTFQDFVISFGSWKSPSISLRSINPRGWFDTTFLDSDFRIGRGDKGSIFVSVRLKR